MAYGGGFVVEAVCLACFFSAAKAFWGGVHWHFVASLVAALLLSTISVAAQVLYLELDALQGAAHIPPGALDNLPILTYPPLVLALFGAIAGCVLSAAGLGLMATGASASGKFVMTRVWFAARGSAPLKLMEFLQDAYKRGVLRQINGYYEFRHRILERYLAEPVPDAPVSVGAPP